MPILQFVITIITSFQLINDVYINIKIIKWVTLYSLSHWKLLDCRTLFLSQSLIIQITVLSSPNLLLCGHVCLSSSSVVLQPLLLNQFVISHFSMLEINLNP